MMEKIGKEVVDSAIQIHKALGPGLLESAYEACMVHELESRGIDVLRQVPMPIHYKGVKLDIGYRLDLLLENSVVVELKMVQSILPIHQAQLLSYLKLGKFRLGYLLNFHVYRMKDGIKRMLNG
jgi:GxxExxY protein